MRNCVVVLTVKKVFKNKKYLEQFIASRKQAMLCTKHKIQKYEVNKKENTTQTT